MNKNTKCEYENDGVRITAPGKFEGEPVFAPHYWGLGAEGFADSDDGNTYKFSFTTEELEKADTAFGAEVKAWLGRKRNLLMSEDGQGFVRCFTL